MKTATRVSTLPEQLLMSPSSFKFYVSWTHQSWLMCQVLRRQSFVVAASTSSQVRVRLLVPEQALQFGEQLKCVGGDAALGN
jgi:hypothetical protein